MKLYYAPGSCSLSPHIVAQEAGIALQLEKVDLQTKRTASGADYAQINPKCSVPCLELDNGERLTEGPAIVQYLADLKPDSALAPPNGSMARYRLQEMLGYVSTEIHKTYGPFFSPGTPEAYLQERKEYLLKRYALLDGHLASRAWLVGEHFTAADAYLFVTLNWAAHVPSVRAEVSAFKSLAAFRQRVAERPGVQAAMRAEGLIQ